jgi:hypothetical protein
MALDLKSGSRGGPERETLRSILRQWEAPAAPPEIEEELRRTFRRRRARRRRPLWLSLAAALALLLAGQVEWTHRRPSTAPPKSPPVRSTPRPSSPPAIALDRSGSPPTASVPPLRERPRPDRRLAKPEVIVEPGQADLLLRFRDSLRDLRPPTTVLSNVPVDVVPAGTRKTPTLTAQAAEVLRYQADWETVAGVWPVVQLSAPIMKR